MKFIWKFEKLLVVKTVIKFGDKFGGTSQLRNTKKQRISNFVVLDLLINTEI